MRTNPLSPSRAPGLLLLLDRLGCSLRSRADEWILPLDQFWSSVFMAVPILKTASVGMLIPPLVGAISWVCQAGGEGSEKYQVVVIKGVWVGERAKWNIWRVRKGVKKAPLLITNVCRMGNQQKWPVRLTHTCRSFFIYLSTWRPRRQKEPLHSSSWSRWCWGHTIIHSWNLEGQLFCWR